MSVAATGRATGEDQPAQRIMVVYNYLDQSGRWRTFVLLPHHQRPPGLAGVQVRRIGPGQSTHIQYDYEHLVKTATLINNGGNVVVTVPLFNSRRQLDFEWGANGELIIKL